MSEILLSKKIRGNKWNWQREADIQVFESGVVRIQQSGDPVDVVLLTARQIDEIARYSKRVRA